MANISAMAKTSHVITAAEAAQGYAVIHLTWSSPFYDTNYNVAYSIEDNTPTNLNFVPGDKHNVTPDGFDATVYLLAVPLVQSERTDIAINTPADISLPVSGPTSTYNVTLYYESLGTGDNSSLYPTITWYNAQGVLQTLTIPYLGAISGDGSGQGLLQSYSLPLLAQGGSIMTVSTQFANSDQTGPGNPFAYNFSASLVALPQTAENIVGNTCIVHAMASHR